MVRNVFVFVFSILFYSLSAQYSIRGKITNADGQPLSGANVVVPNLSIALITDAQGNFLIKKLPSGNYKLSVSYVGYKTLSKDIALSTNLELNLSLEESTVLADEVIVMATRSNNSSLANSNITKESIEKNNLGQDVPFLISLSPSVTITSDAGTGIGYTGFRIRGTDANRVNITVNGIPINDAESHGTFWVNMPDFASSVEDIQIQRGVGTSTNGSGAFGGTINMQTNALKDNRYAEISSAAGSYNTFKNTAKIGTGLVNDHFSFDMRLSKITSDGFVDKASSDLKSFYFSGGYFSRNTIVKAVIFSGKEKTYQSWWGVPKVKLENDTAGMRRYLNHWLWSSSSERINQIKYDELVHSNARTYNYYTYDNQTDNYQQDHYQLFLSHTIGNLSLNAALHYTYGRGYYEEYCMDENLSDYSISNIIVGNDTITTTDLVRQKWLDNDFYGVTFSVNYSTGKLKTTLGGAANEYNGRHFGKIIWAQYLGDIPKDYQWYHSTGIKTDFNMYSKTTYDINDFINLFLDLQLRLISHDIKGIDDKLVDGHKRDITQNHTYQFFNPKFGINLKPAENQTINLFYAIGHREPNRSNFVDADSTHPKPKPEELNDIELGYNYNGYRLSAGANFYYMLYNDQLVLTGELNDVGSSLMINVDKSYRRGIEIFAAVKILNNLTWNLNTTLSQNKILNFSEYVDNWDISASDTIKFGTTNLAFSPDIIANSSIDYIPLKNFTVSFVSQYVGKQYIDNTSSTQRMLDAYFVNNLKLNYTINPKVFNEIEVQLSINNIFNSQYESNAWVYSYIYGGERYEMDGYFPQAGTNFLAGITLKF
jgi:iron complex outermembrane receptor protein